MELHDIIGIGVALGVDCLVVSAAIATTQPPRKTVAFTCVMFGLFQSGMAFGGMAGGTGLSRLVHSPLRFAPPLILCAVGLVMIFGRAGHTARPSRVAGAIALLGAATSVSLDALGAGVAMGMAGIITLASAGIIGLISVGMSLIGFAGGGAVARHAGVAERAGGLVLIALAAVMLATSL